MSNVAVLGLLGLSYGGSSYTAKSVIFDFADNWGAANVMEIRSIEFKLNGSLITMSNSNSTSYGTTDFGTDYEADHAFDTSLSKTGSVTDGTSWRSQSGINDNQRLIIVFDTSQTFDSIVVNNTHHNGGYTDGGVKNTVINFSTDTITNTTYNASISNSTEIFNGQIDEHIASDVADDQVLSLI